MSEAVRYREAFKLRLAGYVANGKYQNLDEAGRRSRAATKTPVRNG
jgi:hypothetical protein